MFNEEKDIIDHFQTVSERSDVLLLPKTKRSIYVYKSIHSQKKWQKWIDNSAEDMPPPDFYSDKHGFMLEIMRVDDHSFKNKKGKLRNPNLEREAKMQKELREAGIFDRFPNAKVICNAVTELPANEDHNYNFYLKNFRRVVNNHKSKADNYKKNHPNYKLVFFIADESSAYIQSLEKKRNDDNILPGDVLFGAPHLFFYDDAFISIIRESEVDYFIWYAPFKHLETSDEFFRLPEVVIYDVKNIKLETIHYEDELMVSWER